MDGKINQQELKDIIRRRKGIFLVSFLSIFSIVAGIAIYLPPIYQSEVTILVENQEIPDEYVRSTITSVVNERLETITQQIMSRSKLSDIIREYDLYPTADTNSEKIRLMREDVNLRTIDAKITEKRTVRAITVLVAFILSYQGKDPETVQQVADVLAKLYVDEELKNREKLAGTTTVFFEKELERLRDNLNDYEEKISAFRSAHIEELPGSIGVILQTISRLEQDLERHNTTIRTLRDKKIYLEGQIASIDPLLPVVTTDGKVASNPKERLKSLQIQLIQMRSNLSDKHPDVKALISEIEKLEAQVGYPDASLEKVKRLQYLKNRLSQSRVELGENHPDVVKLSRETEALSREVQQLGSAAKAKKFAEQKPDNPAYLTIRAQIYAAENEIESLLNDRIRIEGKLEEYRKRVEKAPLVEEEYNKLTLDYESAKNKYHEMMNKFQTAKISREMDLGEQGEQFTIVEPAYYPDRPFKPNRLSIILLGLVVGLGAGIGLAALQESMDRSVKSAEDVERIFGTPVIATVSLFESLGHKRARRSKRLMMAFAMVLIVVCGSFIIDRFLIPLDSMWATFEERLVEIGIPLD